MAATRHNGRLFTFFCLYIAQSVPMSFFTTVIPVIMRQNDFSLQAIGMLQAVKLPWLLKFLWAPFVDGRMVSARSYKRWIIGSELFYALMIAAVAMLDVELNFYTVLLLVVAAVTASATQDVVVDAFATVSFRGKDKSMVNSIQSIGSFMGALLGGGLMLIVYDYLGWRMSLPLLVAFVLVAILPLIWLRNDKTSSDGSCDEKVTLGWGAAMRGFFTQKGASGHIGFLTLYLAPLTGSLAMFKPWMVDMGYDAAFIGTVSGVLGTAVAALGSLVAGVTLKKRGMRFGRTLFAAVPIAATFVPIAVSFLGLTSEAAVAVSVASVWGAYGLSMVVVYTAAMDRTRVGLEGTDFTIQIVLTQLSAMVAAVLCGILADAVGYTGLFVAEAVVGILNLFYVVKLSIVRKR